jgi:MFS family permease
VEGKSNIQTEIKSKPPLEMSSKRRWAVTIGVMTGMFIAALEATVVGTAMPTVISTLGGLNRYSWVFSAYLVTSTVTVPVWGKLYGRRLIYQIAIAVFLLGTLLSGFSETMNQLIIFRAVQGLGAGGLVPLAMTIIGDIYTLEERAKMQAYFSGVWGLSSVVGPVIGGFITDQISWRWVFFINLPVGIVAAIIIGLSLKEPKLCGRGNSDACNQPVNVGNDRRRLVFGDTFRAAEFTAFRCFHCVIVSVFLGRKTRIRSDYSV